MWIGIASQCSSRVDNRRWKLHVRSRGCCLLWTGLLVPASRVARSASMKTCYKVDDHTIILSVSLSLLSLLLALFTLPARQSFNTHCNNPTPFLQFCTEEMKKMLTRSIWPTKREFVIDSFVAVLQHSFLLYPWFELWYSYSLLNS